jgi:hypothetical protein
MGVTRQNRVFLIVVLVSARASAQPPAASQPLTIQHVTIIDTTGGPARPYMTITLRDGRILNIERSSIAKNSENTPIVDGRGKFLIPVAPQRSRCAAARGRAVGEQKLSTRWA